MQFSFTFVGTSGATISVINDCGFTVWPGISGIHGRPEISSSPALNITGFELAQGKSQTLQTPEEWDGQIWGRTGCTFNELGHLSCKTGDCGSGEMECNGRSATSPVTLAEFKGTRFKDYYYDVSLVNGYNLPMTMEATGGSVNSLLSCMKTGCVDDLNKRCPTELMLEGGGGCQSPCQVSDKLEYCCNSPFSCKPTPYSRLFNSACPRSYSAGFFHTSYWCDSANYTVRFCPPSDTFSTIKVGGQLNYYDQLVSIRGNFTLGFFDSDGSYLGIWYTNDAEARKVWVANPNKPIISSSAGICWYSKCHSNVKQENNKQTFGAIFWVYIDKLKGTSKQTNLQKGKTENKVQGYSLSFYWLSLALLKTKEIASTENKENTPTIS
ncbi:putative glucan endo-1,3-beta-D-glucosidase [Helianthus annuus]|nr:putative glucan endo-1,3-beta-D-glucosidase [Helianthus annuus]